MPQTKPLPLISEIVPGTILLLLFAFTNVSFLTRLTSNVNIAFQIGIYFFSAWSIGFFLDTVRDLVEGLIDKNDHDYWWDFFFKGSRQKVDQLNEYYHIYYELSANFAIAGIIYFMVEAILFLMSDSLITYNHFLITLAIIPILIIFVLGADNLRRDMKRLVCEYMDKYDQKITTMPHTKVYTRLGVSKIHGVGVFAIRDIPSGTNIFSDDGSEVVWVNKSVIDNITNKGLKKLYQDFAVYKGEEIMAPNSFNNLTVAWYLNDNRKNPNVICDNDYNFFAARDIKRGEELTADYSTYSDEPS